MRYILSTLVFLALQMPLSLSQPAVAEQQAVLETTLGTIVMELYPEAAPQHVALFRERIQKGFYVGTAFHRAIPYGIIQGGDPLSKDPEKRELYGTGGLFELASEVNDLSHVRGSVSAVLVPGKADSAGSQFFICVTDQVQLDGQYTLFGRVVEGMDVVEAISQAETDQQQMLLERIEIQKTYERAPPPPEEIPFVDTPVAELEQYRVVIETPLGEIKLRFFPEAAPQHVLQFLRFAELGLYQGTTFHRVVPGFVIQGGSLSTRKEKIPEKYLTLVRPLQAEFNEHPHVTGALSMARSDDPNSGLDSFFIVLEPQPGLDGEYTVFGEVVEGIETVDGISQLPTQGETPIQPLPIEGIRVIREEP